MANMSKATILVVDDNPSSVNALIKFLHTAGFETMVAPNGERALRQLELAQPDIILLDFLMPGIDGFETCRRLKEHDTAREIPVIFMTALSETIEKVKGFEVGGVDYLTKPVQHEEVLARVNAHLTIRKLQQQLQAQNARLEEQNLLLEEQNERFRILSEATFEGIIIHDEGRILDVNQMVVRMFGFIPEELQEKTVLDLLPPETRRITEEKIQTRTEHPYEAAGVRKDGSVFPLEMQMKPMPYQEHEILVTAVRDLTWDKNMEEEQTQLRKEVTTLRSTIQDRYKFGEITGRSPAMQEVYQSIVRASSSDANVLICGESGTGKELVAKTIHQLSDRKDKQFVAVNCGAVPETLFEREFFGHRKGAFTGATTDKPGYFDQAHKGTLFLDEVGELHPSLQVKLLRALQENEYTPLGDTVSKKVDVRIIAATNKDLKEQLQQGLIREDFFYRIRVIVINLPPLRDRKEDIPLLIEHFLEQYSNSSKNLAIPARIMDALCTYHWPGNIRELQNELQRYLAEQRLEFIETLNTFAIETDVIQTASDQEDLSLYKVIEEFEKRFITEVFDQNHRNRKNTATTLGIDRKTLYTKLKKYGVI
jgi:PAS domain S-box-containing protein